MSKTWKTILIFIVAAIFIGIGIVFYKTTNSVALVPEPSLGPGIYHLRGAYSDKGMTTFYGNGLIWSPDGKYIAGMVKKYPYPDLCIGCGKPYAELFIIDLTKMEKRIILWSKNPDEFTVPISWFPDSKHLAHMTGGYISNDRKIWSIDLDGNNNVQFMQETGDPIWSPDGTKIAFAEIQKISENWVWSAYLFDLPTQEKRLILRRETTDSFIAKISWGPESKKIFFIYGQEQDIPLNVLLLDLESGYVSQVTYGNYKYVAANYSPKNNLIAFQRVNTGIHQQPVTVIGDFTNNCEVVLPIQGTFSASWSPDGKKLVISTEGDAYIVDLTEYVGHTGSICSSP